MTLMLCDPRCHMFAKVHTACYSTLYLEVALDPDHACLNVAIVSGPGAFHRLFCTNPYFFLSAPTQQHILVVDLR